MANFKISIKSVLKGLLILSIVVAFVIGGFFSFVFIGKDKARSLTLEGIPASSLEDGVYSGSYEGFRWSNSVELTVINHRIMDVRVVESQVYAKEETIQELTNRILAAQVTNVEVVSGATADSNAFLKAVENAVHPSDTEHRD